MYNCVVVNLYGFHTYSHCCIEAYDKDYRLPYSKLGRI